MTKQEAAERWVGEFNAVPARMLEVLRSADMESWREATMPCVGDTVYYYPANDCGEITHIDFEDEQAEYTINIADEKVIATADNIEVERYSAFPAWGTMWSFGDPCDDHWMEKLGGVQVMSDHGFRVYEHDEFGYFFGIDGAGYNFYEHHWLPLYDARGLEWHEQEQVLLHVNEPVFSGMGGMT